jgi:hypothetical protein
MYNNIKNKNYSPPKQALSPHAKKKIIMHAFFQKILCIFGMVLFQRAHAKLSP